MTPELEELGFIDGRLQRIHEFAWHKFIGVIESEPNSLDAWIFDFKWKKISSGWCPPILLPSNLPEFSTGLSRIKNQIMINLYDIESMPIAYQFILNGKIL